MRRKAHNRFTEPQTGGVQCQRGTLAEVRRLFDEVRFAVEADVVALTL
jgi:hypothetical protein